MARVIGITGGIASGKSAVTDMLHQFPIIDADEIAREVVRPGQPGLEAIRQTFGEELIDANGHLRRRQLRQRIAVDETTRQQLNAILHPLIGQEIQRQINHYREKPVVFVSAALMLETGSYQRYDAVILVSAPYAVRLQRLLVRDQMTEELARELMNRQWSDEQKRPLVQAEIVNDADLTTLARRSEAALRQLGIKSELQE